MSAQFQVVIMQAPPSLNSSGDGCDPLRNRALTQLGMLHLNPFEKYDDLRHFTHVPVHHGMMNEVQRMSIRDPTCITCLTLLRYSIATDSINLAAKRVGDYPDLTNHVLCTYWGPFASNVLMHFLKFGFCPFYLRTVMVDGSLDAAWMARFGDERKRQKRDFKTTFVVPVVPPYGTWRTFVVRITDLEAILVSFPSAPLPRPHDLLAERHADGSSGPLHTILMHHDTMPGVMTGELQSLMASLASSHLFTARIDDLSLRAAHTRAHPTVVLQHVEKEFKPDSMYVERSFANSDIGFVATDQKYRSQVGATARVRQAQETFSDALRTGAPPLPFLFAAPASTYVSGQMSLHPPSAPLTHPIQDALFVTPPLLGMGPQPTMPEEPAHYQFQHMQHVQRVCGVFSVPASMVQASSLARGSRELAELDLTNFNLSMTALQNTLKARLEETFAYVMELAKMEELSLGVRSHTSVDDLLVMFRTEAITHPELSEALRRRIGHAPLKDDSHHTTSIHQRVMDRLAGSTGSKPEKKRAKTSKV